MTNIWYRLAVVLLVIGGLFLFARLVSGALNTSFSLVTVVCLFVGGVIFAIVGLRRAPSTK